MRVHYGILGRGVATVLGLGLLTASYAPRDAHAAAAVGQQKQTQGKKPGADKPKQIRTPLDVSIESWNSREHVPPAPTPIPRPRQSFDPMGVSVAGAKSDTKVTILRQKKSAQVKLPKCVGSECTIQEAAKEAAQWAPVLSYSLGKTAPGTPVRKVVTRDEDKVMWPNSRFKIEATTPDGRSYPPVHGVVAGRQNIQEQVFNYERDGIQHLQTGGMMLPSARAWIQEGNLFVSEPTKNPKQIAQGKAKLQQAENKERAAAVKMQKMQRYQQGREPKMTPQHYNLLQAEHALLTSEAQTLRAEGTEMIASGEKVAVNVISAGAYPAAAQVSVANPRTGMQEDATAHPESGYLMQRIDAAHKDQLTTTVSFPAQWGRNVGSSRSIDFTVPSKARKPAFEMNGIKYYPVVAKNAQQVNDPAVASGQ